MSSSTVLTSVCAGLPALLMLLAMPHRRGVAGPGAWPRFQLLAWAALAATVASLGLQLAGASPASTAWVPGLGGTLAGAWVAVLVQGLGTVIGAFSSRYLHGEPGQPRYVAALGGVLAAVHLLLLADHWLVLIAAWSAVGLALQRLLCFYPERPFAQLAAHKKRLADGLADGLLVAAAALAWFDVGSGSLPQLWQHLESGARSVLLQASAVCLALAVVLRTALLPMHGWLIQVMEAPTPVSALLHAGVVNLGGFMLIRFAPLLDVAPLARGLLVALGLTSALLAALVMLTRVSIKLRLAWSTVAQMGFMVVECALGLHTLALLHLMGHSLYKAHAFLAASTAVDATRLRMMCGSAVPSVASLVAAPAVAVGLLMLLTAALPRAAWPVWWNGVLAFAWAPLLWQPARSGRGGWARLGGWATGCGMVAALALAAWVGHAVPLGVSDAPRALAGWVVLAGLAALYCGLARVQVHPQALATWRRWSYAGFYIDEFVTRAVLRLWPARWMPAASA